jgi:hypothetical protein
MAEPFSINQEIYTSVCTESNMDKCITYKKNADALNTTKQQYQDMTESQSAIIMSNIGLGIGVLSMVWMISRM